MKIKNGAVVPFLFKEDASVHLQERRKKVVYFVATVYFDEKKEKKEYLDYIKKVKPIVNKYHGRYITRSEKITPLSTEWRPNRVVIIEFDTREWLDKCFSSEEYTQIASLREKSVDSKAIIIE